MSEKSNISVELKTRVNFNYSLSVSTENKESNIIVRFFNFITRKRVEMKLTEIVNDIYRSTYNKHKVASYLSGERSNFYLIEKEFSEKVMQYTKQHSVEDILTYERE